MFEDKFIAHQSEVVVSDKGLNWSILKKAQDAFVVLSAYIASRVALLIIGLTALHIIPKSFASQLHFPDYSSPSTWLGLWYHWDSAWYAGIAEHGYGAPILNTGDTFGQASFAFFPLLPLLTKILSEVFGLKITIAGFLLSNGMIVIAGIYLYKYVLLRFGDRQIALVSVIVMYFFPGSFVYSGFMSESLYLGLSVISFFYMEKEQYGRGAVAASLATVARSPGILIFFIFLLHWLRKNHNTKSILENDWQSFLKILLIPLPLMIFMGFLLSKFGSAFAFSQVHVFWGRSLSSPMHNLFSNLLYFRNGSDITGAILSFTAFFSVFFIVAKFKALTAEETIFSMAGILVPLSTSLESAIRICDVIFPLFMAISLFCNKYPRLGCQLVAFLAMINALLMTFWVLGAQFYV